MHINAWTMLFCAMLLLSHPAKARSLESPPPFLAVSTLQYMCDETFEQSENPVLRKTAGECRGYIRAVVDRYFATELTLKEGQVLPTCDWRNTTDLLIGEVRESVNGPIAYSRHSAAEPWLRDRLKKRCGE